MKLKRIKLINWHVFSNETIELDGNILVTGENGTGKSTFIDALYYCISGGDGKNFNNAAQEKGKRDIEGYIRGKIGKEGQAYLRENSTVISHIALEFLDKTNKPMVLGVVLELSSSLDEKFYTVDGYKMADEDFINDKNGAASYNELRAHLKLKGLEPHRLDKSRRVRRKQIGKDIFKIDNYERYYDLLKSAVGFRAITEVSSFVNNFLLNEDNINLSSIRDEIRDYKEIRNTLLKEKAKLDLLAPFMPKALRFVDNLRKIKYLSIAKTNLEIDELNSKLENKKLQSLRYENEIEGYNDKLEEAHKKEVALEYEKSSLENNEEYKALLQKKKEISRLEEEINIYNTKLNVLHEQLKNEMSIIKGLKLSYKLGDDFKERNYPLLMGHLQRYKAEFDKLKADYYRENARLDVEREKNDDTRKAKEAELSKLEGGKNNYDKSVTELIEVIKNELALKFPHDKKISVRPLCELLEIEDKRWTNAIEGYLNTQRFDLIVDGKYYDAAAKAYNDYKDARGIYGVGLINVKKIKPQRAEKNSLYQMLKHKHGDADRVAEMILGRVIAVEAVDELKNYDIAITPNVMIYKNHTLRACNKRVYMTPYIGEDSVLRRIELLKNELLALNEEKQGIDRRIKENNDKLSLIDKSQIKELLDSENYWLKLDNALEARNSYLADIDALNKSKGLLGINERIEACDRSLALLIALNRELEEKKTEASQKIGKLDSEMEVINQNLAYNNQKYEEQYKKLDNITDYEGYIEDYKLDGNLDAERVKKDFDSATMSNMASQESLVNTMRDYTNRYKQAMSPLIENINDYINEYNIISNRDIIKYQDKADEAYRNAKESFQEDFISKLYEKIISAKQMLDDLNKHLKKIPFGPDQEIYKFTCNGSKDSDFQEYYKIITSGKDMKAQNLFTELLDPKEEEVMKNLFNHISVEATTSDMEKELSRYLDYRNYMSYDIKITNKDGDETYFSKVNKEKSGGETQTPFYVIIAACFDELMDKEKGYSTAIVILDEAFNNMDEGRIEALMSFYKALSIQFAVVVPTIRSTVIVPYVENAYGLIKHKNRSKFLSFATKVKDNEQYS